MLRKTKDLKGSKLAARDGEIGHLKDFYFDEQTWTTRYLVADTGTWLPNRQVLLSPFAVTHIGRQAHAPVEVSLTRKQIEDSPSIEEHRPVSRRFEAEYMQYYGWPDYWPGPLLWGPVQAPWAYIPANLQTFPHRKTLEQDEDSHLRSMQDVSGFSGYQIQALDQLFGHVEYFIIDDHNWAVRYLVCDTHAWLPGKHFLLAPQWTAWVSWSDSRVYIDLDRDTIRHAPEYNPAAELTREYEEKLFAHYNREPYWAMELAVKSSEASTGGSIPQQTNRIGAAWRDS
jgi:hypothetical protein